MASIRPNQFKNRSQPPASFEVLAAPASVHSRLSDRVYAFVLAQVFDGTLKPGQRITEGRVAEDIDVSMVSVREAMAKLAQDGWVDRYPNRGSYISDFQRPGAYLQLCRLRATMEIGAFHYLAENITPPQISQLRQIVDSMNQALKQDDPQLYRQGDIQFHQTAIHFTAGERLDNIFRPMLLQCMAFSSVRPELPGFLENTIDQRCPEFSHHVLLKALADHQPAQAAHVIQQHVMRIDSADASQTIAKNPSCDPEGLS